MDNTTRGVGRQCEASRWRKFDKRGRSGQYKMSGWQTMQGDGAAEDTTCSSPFLSKGAATMDDLMDDLMDDG